MSLETRISDLVSTIGTDIKAMQTVGPAASVWTEEFLAATYTNATVTGTSIFTGFTPAISTRYLIEAWLIHQSDTVQHGAQFSILGPTGMLRTSVKFKTPSSATADNIAHQNAVNAYVAATTGLTTPVLAMAWGIINVGPTPSAGKITVGGRAEVAGTNALQVFRGSFLRWRVL